MGKPCSGYKLKEMNGKSFLLISESGSVNGSLNNRTSVRIVQQAANGISQISFSTDERISPKKHITLTEVTKQRELSGTLESDSDSNMKKQLSDAKSKELNGNDIFGPPAEIPPRSLAAARSIDTSVKVSNPAGGQSNILFGDEPVVNTVKKIHNQKFAELTGNDIFKGEKPLSRAKLREMSGNDIFSDGKVESRDILVAFADHQVEKAASRWFR
ncbi:hypothetical protein H5410_026390 [Solanum commersonii]|uniref:DUF4057 domain-containing protein n=1 Tax=Solanum commersonii TaxID=4109 RepID=A0A9J5YWX4_SOLCO|nr:hypothetical protein H5410_026390 [Solanum commersonii]